MKIEDIIVKIKLANEKQKDKGILGFGKMEIPIDITDLGKKFIAIKGFMVWGQSKYNDGVKGRCSISPPCKPRPPRKPLYFIFFEDENFDEDKILWERISQHILRAYYRALEYNVSDDSI